MNDGNERIIKLYLVSIILFQIIFLAEAIFCYDIIIVPNPAFRKLTLEEWNWIIQRGSRPHETALLIWTDLLNIVFGVIYIVGFFHLFFVKKRLLPIRTLWIIATLAAGFVTDLPLFYYFKYQAEHYRLYMSSVSLEIDSLMLLVLILIGLAARRAKRDRLDRMSG